MDIGTILLIQVRILFGFHQFYMHAFFQLLKKEIIILSKRWLKKIKENFGGRKPGGKFQLCHLPVGSWVIHLNFLSLSFFLHKMEITVELLWGLNNLYEHIMLGHCCNRFVEKSKLIRVWTWRKQFVFPVTEINWMSPSPSLMTTWAGSFSFGWENLKPGLASWVVLWFGLISKWFPLWMGSPVFPDLCSCSSWQPLHPWEPPSSEGPLGPIWGTTLGPFSGGHLDMGRCHLLTNLQAPSPGALGAPGSLLILSEGAEIWDEVESFPISSPASPLLWPLKMFRYLVTSHPWKHLDLCGPIR